ncbi:predicted protein [Sclerotinia sclerotiorum 1980 UF-70]|uniref:Uncharacterized protein n=1 Tax=Sclerotinia sclerotiorum (strain ATCC 18683 / 1980 / Ss-1) TaxID=665079 RepID=A7EZ99_SCLS1|nr:predicted protein [Sclerotinia sclerotiorum 1980 UF-70]EDN94791.1 predicted protein [Sclerotinia sclerotiorum 1980 UF-70]
MATAPEHTFIGNVEYYQKYTLASRMLYPDILFLLLGSEDILKSSSSVDPDNRRLWARL